MQEIAPANCIVFVNDFGNAISTTNHDHLVKLFQAVRSAKRDKHVYSAVFQSRLKFYSGTNLLGEVRCQDRAFWIGDEQYSDESGVLDGLYHKSATDPSRAFE